MFQKKVLISDVLCVAANSRHILAGVGNYLFIYENKKLKLKLNVFQGERVHNIYLYGDTVILKGCKEVSVLSYLSHAQNYQITYHIRCRDWIQDILFDTRKKELIVATAHNAIEIWNIESKNCIQCYICEEKCILYSSKFIGSGIEDFILLCGTVFSEIIVWAPIQSSTVDQPVLQRLKGHDGVIFSIAFDPQQNLICSTSDDRSLRVWLVDAGGSALDRKSWKNAHISLVYTLYGHTARVWKSLILNDLIISAGEDSKICMWNKSSSLESCLDLHQESGIRGLCTLTDTQSIITGGEDGGIILLTSNNLNPQVPSLTTKGCYDLAKKEFGQPRKVAFFQGGFIITTDRGCVLFVEEPRKAVMIYENREFSSYCVSEVSVCKTYLLLGSLKGRVVIIKGNDKMVCFDDNLISGKIYSFHWLYKYLIICGDNGVITVFKVNFDDVINVKREKVFMLPSMKERWTTCALIHRNYLILGDRMGNIQSYSLKSAVNYPQQRFTKIHGNQGVTNIIKDGDIILTCGRDGSVKKFDIDENGLVYCLKYKLPMEWPWKMVKYKDETLILGFSSIFFVVWNLNKREFMGRYDCGGGHRSCDFVISDDICTLLHIRNKGVYFSRIKLLSSIHIQTGFHGKEINCLKVIQEYPLILVTGSEDTTLRISRVKENSLEQLYVLEDHISSIRDLHIYPVSTAKKLIFSVGGRAQFAVHEFNVNTLKCKELNIQFLNELDRKMNDPAVESETRIMCVDSVTSHRHVLLAAACSDRHIRIFYYGESLSLFSSIPYTHCILKVKCLHLKSLLIVISMGTDGRAVFWDVTSIISKPTRFRKIHSIPIHQSGINSFEFSDVGNGHFLLVTGGDDNLLSVLLLYFDNNFRPRISTQWTNSNAHSGQITGIKLVGNILLTASTDQRLTVWEIDITAKIISVRFINQYLSSVADTQGIEAIQHTRESVLVCLYGKGLEIIEININKT